LYNAAVDIFKLINDLNLKRGTYTITGGAVLQAYGLRDANDIDILVLPKVYREFRLSGWPEQETATGRIVLVKGIYEMGRDWNFPMCSFTAKVTDLIKSSDIINSIPFVSLEEVLRWKKSLKRRKDLLDIKLISDYLMPKPLGIEPLLYVTNLDKAIAFYTEVLGFKLGDLSPNSENPTYTSIFAGDSKMVLALKRAVKKKFIRNGLGGSGAQFFLPVKNVDDSYVKIKRKIKVENIVDDIRNKHRGYREFTISDPDAYLLTFYTILP